MIAENLIGFEMLPQTIPHYCLESFRRNNKPDALAFKVDEVWKYLSGTEVIEKVRRIALGLSELGVKAGRPDRDHFREPSRMVADRPRDPQPSGCERADLHDAGR